MAPSPLRLSPAIRARLGYVALFTAVGALYPYIPIYYSSLGLDVGAIGLLAAIFSAAAMLGSPLWGAAGDRLGRSRAVLLIPASLAALAFWALAVAQGMWIVGIAAAAASFAMSGVSPVLDACGSGARFPSLPARSSLAGSRIGLAFAACSSS